MSNGLRVAGDWPLADYKEQVIAQYRGNPFIEALPPILDDGEAVEAMQNLIQPEPAELGLPAVHRIHMLARIDKELMQPLDFHIGLFHRISALLRAGYVDRNPASPAFVRDLAGFAAELGRLTSAESRPSRGRVKAGTRQRIGGGSGLTLIGSSGVGKTHAIEAVLRCYDQVIRHEAIKGPLAAVLQLVYLKLSVPQDGSIRSLCLDFLDAVDEAMETDYRAQHGRSGATVDTLIIVMGRIAFIHGLGMFVIDELQNLNVAKSGGDTKMMNTFKLLRDVMKVPVVLIGTPEAIGILSDDFQVARRHSGLPPMGRMGNDEQFRFFCETLFDAQYLREPLQLTDGIVELLHWLSQGIADVAMQVFVGAQRIALSRRAETMDAGTLEEAYDLELGLLHPFLGDLRRGKDVNARLFDAAIDTARRERRGDPGGEAQARGRAPEVGGVSARRFRRKGGEPSACVLVCVVQEGEASRMTPHQALLEEGFVRQLGAEALGA